MFNPKHQGLTIPSLLFSINAFKDMFFFCEKAALFITIVVHCKKKLYYDLTVHPDNLCEYFKLQSCF